MVSTSAGFDRSAHLGKCMKFRLNSTEPVELQVHIRPAGRALPGTPQLHRRDADHLRRIGAWCMIADLIAEGIEHPVEGLAWTALFVVPSVTEQISF